MNFRTTPATKQTKVIIDTDCGVDDAFALLVALETLDVVAITCVAGNAHIDRVTENVATVLALADRKDIPFFRGSENFLMSDFSQDLCWVGHGVNGLGDAKLDPVLVEAASALKPGEESAVDALLRITREQEDVHVVAVGPLTNIALATLIDPGFSSRVGSFSIMGGAHQAKGNSNLASEWNIHADPEAAAICLRKFKLTRMITWETTYKHSLDWKWWDSLTQSKYVKFIRAINDKARSITKNFTQGFIVPDLIAILSYFAEAERSEDMYCEVELAGKHTRGATVFSWMNNSSTPNVRLIKLDKDNIQSILEKALHTSSTTTTP
jgi:inosine-uridine nucleoside N-ribohydrolase